MNRAITRDEQPRARSKIRRRSTAKPHYAGSEAESLRAAPSGWAAALCIIASDASICWLERLPEFTRRRCRQGTAVGNAGGQHRSQRADEVRPVHQPERPSSVRRQGRHRQVRAIIAIITPELRADAGWRIREAPVGGDRPPSAVAQAAAQRPAPSRSAGHRAHRAAQRGGDEHWSGRDSMVVRTGGAVLPHRAGGRWDQKVRRRCGPATSNKETKVNSVPKASASDRLSIGDCSQMKTAPVTEAVRTARISGYRTTFAELLQGVCRSAGRRSSPQPNQSMPWRGGRIVEVEYRRPGDHRTPGHRLMKTTSARRAPRSGDRPASARWWGERPTGGDDVAIPASPAENGIALATPRDMAPAPDWTGVDDHRSKLIARGYAIEATMKITHLSRRTAGAEQLGR